MKPSSNSISGIKMSSNENDAMEWNDVLSETNILICYMPKNEATDAELRHDEHGNMN